MKKHKKILKYICILGLILFVALGLNPTLQTTEYIYESTEIPASFDNYTICHISDLHCKSFGKDNQKLLSAINKMNPDIIVLTGDIVDEDHDDLSAVESLFQGIEEANIPCYYVTGNHELEDDAVVQYGKLLNLIEKYNITNLDDKKEILTKGDDSITLTGSKWYSRYVVNFLVPTKSEGFNILL